MATIVSIFKNLDIYKYLEFKVSAFRNSFEKFRNLFCQFSKNSYTKKLKSTRISVSS